jgi:hypothetical protein
MDNHMVTNASPDLATQLAAERAAHQVTKVTMGKQLVDLHAQVQAHAQAVADRDHAVAGAQRLRDQYQAMVADLTTKLMLAYMRVSYLEAAYQTATGKPAPTQQLSTPPDVAAAATTSTGGSP